MRKNIVLYAVKSFSDPIKIYTVVNTKKEAEEYINRKLILENLQDFDSWCFYQHVSEDNKPLAWVKYFNTRLPEEERTKYRYYKIKYSYEEVACIIRMFCGCKVIGCSFDTKEEKAYVSQKVEAQNRVTEMLSEYLKQILPDDTDSDTDDSSNDAFIQ